MERFSAELFYRLARTLEFLQATGKFATNASHGVPKKDLRLDARNLKLVASTCSDIDLRLSAKYALKMSGRFARKALTFQERSQEFEVLQERIQDELTEHLFMFIPPERAFRYDQVELFGKAVNGRFPAIQYDIAEAGNCYAAGRSTACVFHLMRIMETGMQEFGRVLNVSLVNEKNWQNILDEVNRAIKALPQKDPRTVKLSQASASLYAVKLAWRNEVMHPKATYTLEEADNLIRQVKLFMENLATICRGRVRRITAPIAPDGTASFPALRKTKRVPT